MSKSLAEIALVAGRKSSIPFEKRARRVFAAKLADIRAAHPGKLRTRHCQRQLTLQRRHNCNGEDFAYFHIPR